MIKDLKVEMQMKPEENEVTVYVQYTYENGHRDDYITTVNLDDWDFCTLTSCSTDFSRPSRDRLIAVTDCD